MRLLAACVWELVGILTLCREPLLRLGIRIAQRWLFGVSVAQGEYAVLYVELWDGKLQQQGQYRAEVAQLHSFSVPHCMAGCACKVPCDLLIRELTVLLGMLCWLVGLHSWVWDSQIG